MSANAMNSIAKFGLNAFHRKRERLSMLRGLKWKRLS